MNFDFKQFAGFCKKVYKINLEIVKASKYYDKMWTRANRHLQDAFNKNTSMEFRLSGLCAEIDPFDSNTSIDNVILTGELKSKSSKNRSSIYLDIALPLSVLASNTWIQNVEDFILKEVASRETEDKLIYERLQKKFKKNA